MEAFVVSWKYLIAVEMASLLLSTIPNTDYDPASRLKRFLEENYGGVKPTLDVLLRPKSLKMSRVTVEPQVLGNKLGSISLERNDADKSLGVELNALSVAIMEAVHDTCQHWNVNKLELHFDELDQGIVSFQPIRKMMIVGLVLAARSLRRMNQGRSAMLNAYIYLRTDFWDQLTFSDKNKISETATLNLEWNGDSLLALVNERLKKRLGAEVQWTNVIDDDLMRGSQSKWNHIIARTFLRPRDVIKFLNASLLEAKKRTDEVLVFSNKDIVSARESYSGYLKKELDDEIIAHWPLWAEALQCCSAIGALTFNREEFVTEYTMRRSAQNTLKSEEALAVLYNFSVLGYERRSGYGGSSWAFAYTDQEAGWDPQSERFKVHIGLKEYAKLREERN